ncbi:MAG: hypothetical protein CMI16_13155 [Opitutaceae bacterium]|nr:hypothetical protein [Opitutaceae bacterium]|tara:strand:+ start:467 stop:799 length:333 start_codon:yes stop_codon:yes gene_type:complete
MLPPLTRLRHSVFSQAPTGCGDENKPDELAEFLKALEVAARSVASLEEVERTMEGQGWQPDWLLRIYEIGDKIEAADQLLSNVRQSMHGRYWRSLYQLRERLKELERKLV